MGVEWGELFSGHKTTRGQVSHFYVSHGKSGYFAGAFPSSEYADNWRKLLQTGGYVHEFWSNKKSLDRSDFIFGEFASNNYIFILPRKKISGGREATVLDTWVSDDELSLLGFLSDRENFSNLEFGAGDVSPWEIIPSFLPIWKWCLLESNEKKKFAFGPEDVELEKLNFRNAISMTSSNSENFDLGRYRLRNSFADLFITVDSDPVGHLKALEFLETLVTYSSYRGINHSHVLSLFLLENGLSSISEQFSKSQELSTRFILSDRSGAFECVKGNMETIQTWMEMSLSNHGPDTPPFNLEELDSILQSSLSKQISTDWLVEFQRQVKKSGYSEKIRLMTAIWILNTSRVELDIVIENIGQISYSAIEQNVDEIKSILPSKIDEDFYKLLARLEGKSGSPESRRRIIMALFDKKIIHEEKQIVALSGYLGGFLSTSHLYSLDLQLSQKICSLSPSEIVEAINFNGIEKRELQGRITYSLGDILPERGSKWRISTYLPDMNLASDYEFMYPIIKRCAELGILPPSDSGALSDNLSPAQFYNLHKLEQTHRQFQFLSGKEVTSVSNGWKYPGYYQVSDAKAPRKKNLIELAIYLTRKGSNPIKKLTFPNRLISVCLLFLYATFTAIALFPTLNLPSNTNIDFQTILALISSFSPAILSGMIWLVFGKRLRSSKSKIASSLIILIVFLAYYFSKDLTLLPEAIPWYGLSVLGFKITLPGTPGLFLALLPIIRIIQVMNVDKLNLKSLMEGEHRQHVDRILRGHGRV